MSFYEWFTTFLEEKKIDLSEPVGRGIQVGDVCQAIVDTSEDEQKKIKNTIVKIDFFNGDVIHFFKHLGQALGTKQVEDRRQELVDEFLGAQLCETKKAKQRNRK